MADQLTRKFGRPSKYEDWMLEEIYKLMSVGASITEVAAKCEISKETLYDWIDPESPRFNVDFSDAIKRGVQMSEAWWEEQGRVNLQTKEFSFVGWYMNMKNRFGWRDKNELSGPDGQPLNPAPKDDGKLDEVLEILKGPTADDTNSSNTDTPAEA